MIQSILSNLAIILLMHLIMCIIVDNRKRLPNQLFFLFIVLLFSGSVISMYYLPIEFGGGYRVDLRLIPLIFLAYLRGWKVTLPVLLIVSVWRYFAGGIGSIPGIFFGMIGPTLFTLAFYKSNKILNHYVEKILIITGCWFISDFPITFLVPNGLEIFEKIFIWRYSSILGVCFILYSFIILEYRRQDYKNQFEYLAWHDSLTKLLNRSKFFEVIEQKMHQSTCNHYLAMIDLDHFKRLNDTCGHIAGDHILIKVADIFKHYESENVKIGRYGGEEFIIYQGETSYERSLLTLETIRKEIRSTQFLTNHDTFPHVTVSIGVSKIENFTQLKEAVKQADKNLYIAKKNGRDQVVGSNNFTASEFDDITQSI